MNRQFVVSVIVLFVWTMLAGMVIHGMLLGAEYAALPGLYRPEHEQANYFSYMLAAHVSMAIAITWIYRMGRENRPWPVQGLRFGIALVLLLTFPVYMVYYAAQPMPGDLVARQIVFDSVAVVLTGLIAAFVNR